MHANRCHTCLRILDWTSWQKDSGVELNKRLEKHGYTRRCCRRMMLASMDPYKDAIALLNTERNWQLRETVTPVQKQACFQRWFPTSYTPPISTPIPSHPTTDPPVIKTSSKISRIHVCE